ncbi:copper resistance CopC family protein [Meiothermus granaticius]|uniref:CopC domain protein n=1 Tax=Meiothermus granaticius NBRC 107808 TaxID=1227551 RepID=A0A399F9T2_9DEIN|nr:copper resistance protein CopC [Meiothermus granaticius]RIH92998.1 CopC domain protein [Meiothermus granaticius NBRC 107808]GEM86164.1 hypothetical protein MGR01S_07890 [Meiothermus granaticius NBRC 107808]
MRPLLAFLLLVSGLALAHAELESSIPAMDSTVKIPPQSVSITFTEAVEVKLSVFKVYPLPGSGSLERLNQQAQALLPQVIGLKGDQARRADSGLRTTAKTSSQVVIGLKPGLKPGAYAVLWRNLATDGHTSSDFFVFIYRP